MLKFLIITIVFLLGLYFTCRYTSRDIIEGFESVNNNCPNILIQKDKELYLYNSRKAKIPGVNPVKFNNLEDYVEFLDWQRVKILDVLFCSYNILMIHKATLCINFVQALLMFKEVFHLC